MIDSLGQGHNPNFFSSLLVEIQQGTERKMKQGDVNGGKKIWTPDHYTKPCLFDCGLFFK